MAEWQSGYAAACKAADAGSIPTSASINLYDIIIISWQALTNHVRCPCPGGGIGRRKGLKIPRSLIVPVRFRLRAPFQYSDEQKVRIKARQICS